MKKRIALSVLGKDKPGIVAAVSKALFETGCNIEDSSMTLLRSEFAMILLVELPNSLSVSSLETKLKSAVEKLKLSTSIRMLSSREGKSEKPKGSPYIISVFGADKPGIVFGVSQLLSANKINITDVQTNISSDKGKNVYVMLLEADLPKRITLASLTKKLQSIGRKLKVSVAIHPVEMPQL